MTLTLSPNFLGDRHPSAPLFQGRWSPARVGGQSPEFPVDRFCTSPKQCLLASRGEPPAASPCAVVEQIPAGQRGWQGELARSAARELLGLCHRVFHSVRPQRLPSTPPCQAPGPCSPGLLLQSTRSTRLNPGLVRGPRTQRVQRGTITNLGDVQTKSVNTGYLLRACPREGETDTRPASLLPRFFLLVSENLGLPPPTSPHLQPRPRPFPPSSSPSQCGASVPALPLNDWVSKAL